jgi:hypothetical protein
MAVQELTILVEVVVELEITALNMEAQVVAVS